MKPQFQQLLDQYQGDLKFERLEGTLELSPDEFLYMIETDQGMYYIFETDYILDSEGMGGFEYIVMQIKERTEHLSHFVEAKHPLEKDMLSAMYHIRPKDFPLEYERFKKYLSIGYGSFGGYFTFLIKK